MFAGSEGTWSLNTTMTDCVACRLSARAWAALNAADVVEAPARPAGTIIPAMSPKVATHSAAKRTL